MQQRDLFVEFADPPVDHLFDNVVGLARCFCLLDENRALSLKHFRVKVVWRHGLRTCGGNVHRHLAPKGVKLRFVTS